jgi:hypothetical protein
MQVTVLMQACLDTMQPAHDGLPVSQLFRRNVPMTSLSHLFTEILYLFEYFSSLKSFFWLPRGNGSCSHGSVPSVFEDDKDGGV